MRLSWSFDEGTAMRNVVSKAEVLPDPLSLGWNVLGYRQFDVCEWRVVVEFLCVFACVCVRVRT